MKAEIRQMQSISPEGLKNGGHVILSCSNCYAGLVDFFVTRPGEINARTGKPFNWIIQANCPFCGDKSFTKEINGNGHVGGYGTPYPDNEDETIPSTIVTGSDLIDGVMFFKVEKAEPNAKPKKVRS